MENKQQLFSKAQELSDLLQIIYALLDGYNGLGIENSYSPNGNKNYIQYCFTRSMANINSDMQLNFPRNNVQESKIIEEINFKFQLLDDIDTASDMFKPKWCPITKAVSKLADMRWMYCSIQGKNQDANGLMVVNSNCSTPKFVIQL